MSYIPGLAQEAVPYAPSLVSLKGYFVAFVKNTDDSYSSGGLSLPRPYGGILCKQDDNSILSANGKTPFHHR